MAMMETIAPGRNGTAVLIMEHRNEIGRSARTHNIVPIQASVVTG